MRKVKKRDRGHSQALVQAGSPAGAAGTRQYWVLRINPSEQSIEIDVTKLEAPARAYDADFAWVEHRVGEVSLMFAKGNREDPTQLKSRMEVRYPVEDLLLTFWNPSRSFFRRTEKYVADWPEEAHRQVDAPDHLRSLQTHSEWASFAYMSHSGTEAAIDFYHLSPAGLARLAQGNDLGDALKLLPVVRVQLTTFELFRLVLRVQPIIEQIRAYLPERHSVAKKVPSSFDVEDEAAETPPAQRVYGS